MLSFLICETSFMWKSEMSTPDDVSFIISDIFYVNVRNVLTRWC